MPRVIDSGTPLQGAPAAPLWTDTCDNSSYLPDNTAIPDLVINMPDVAGYGTNTVESLIPSPSAVASVRVDGTLKGRLNDQLAINLVHSQLGTLPVLNRILSGDVPFSFPYPSQSSIVERTFLVGQTVPTGWTFIGTSGAPSTQTVEVPAESDLKDYLYSFYGSGVFSSPVTTGYSGEGASYVLSVPAHRQPWAPNGNWENSTIDNHNATQAVFFHNVRYVPSLPALLQPASVRTIQIPSGSNIPQDYSEPLYGEFGAHEISFLGNISVVQGTGFVEYSEYLLVTWPPITWTATPMSTVIVEFIAPPAATYRYIPPDYANYKSYAERTDDFSVTLYDWRNKPIEGQLSLQLVGSNFYYQTYYQDSYPPGDDVGFTVGYPTLQDVVVTISFRSDQPWELATLETTAANGKISATTQGNLIETPDDRCLIGIFCGINGSNSMGILCGYAVQRTSLASPLFSISYFLGTTCNLNHVNMMRMRQSISYINQDWSGATGTSGEGFSTHGNLGQPYVIQPIGNKIYPIKGEIGLKICIVGTRLIFQLLGEYPPLVFDDPTVPLVTNFFRYSLNS